MGAGRQVVAHLSARVARAKGSSASQAQAPAEPRIVALDGLRGLMTIMVVLSHYFAEVAHGFKGLSFGWIAVDMFFVLSGYLVGRLILEKMDRANFVLVFYVRRVCRTLPVYFFCVVLVFLLIGAFADRPWADKEAAFPHWSYLTFFQNFYMVSTNTIAVAPMQTDAPPSGKQLKPLRRMKALPCCRKTTGMRSIAWRIACARIPWPRRCCTGRRDLCSESCRHNVGTSLRPLPNTAPSCVRH